MAAAVEVRGDYSANRVLKAAKASSDAGQCRRLLAIAAILDGGSRSEAAKIGGVGLQTVRDWVAAFQRGGTGGSDRPQGPRQAAEARCGPSSSFG